VWHLLSICVQFFVFVDLLRFSLFDFALRVWAGLPPVAELKVYQQAEIWRVEIRFFKRYLKNTWRVTTFGDLAAAMPKMLQKTIQDIRYTQPNDDSNRARWPDHLLAGHDRRRLSAQTGRSSQPQALRCSFA